MEKCRNIRELGFWAGLAIFGKFIKLIISAMMLELVVVLRKMMKYFVSLFLLLFLILPGNLIAEKSKKNKKINRPVLGWVEKAYMPDGELTLHAKLDTGHTGTSVHAIDVKTFKKKKENWVKFKLKDRYGKEKDYEREVLRKVTYKGSGKKSRTEYVVELGICLGGEYFEDEMSLSDRDGFSQELRLGRQSLEGHFMVDPALTYTTKPDCKTKKSN